MGGSEKPVGEIKSKQKLKMMRKILLSLMLLPMFAPAAMAGTALVVAKSDGTTETFLLSQKPEISFGAADCTVSTADCTVSIPRGDIADFHFSDVATAISSPSAEGGVSVRIAGGAVTIQGAQPSGVSVSDASGKAVNASVATSGTACTVSLAGLPKGIYIVKYGKNTIKTANK